MSLQARTLYEKIFDSHVVKTKENKTVLLYIDRHLVHEVTSPQAFEGLRLNHRPVRRPDLTLATSDHNVPTTSRKGLDEDKYIRDAESRLQCLTLERNAKKHSIRYFGLKSINQGIVHVIGPELGFTLPGLTIVCGDSHTSTHGAFGALAFGIGTTEVEHVLATQTLVSTRLKNMKIQVDGKLGSCVTSKDIILYIIGIISTAGGTGMVIEFMGSTIKSLSMESRMSLCNMSVEAGAKAGLVAPDQTTLDYLKERPLVCHDPEEWSKATAYWLTLQSDPNANFDRTLDIDAADITPHVTWGTSPEQVIPITGVVPDPAQIHDKKKREAHITALEYMDLQPGTPIQDIKVDKVFIGSCTNGRLEDLRAAARILQGSQVSPNVKLALVVPGSGLVKQAAEREGLDIIFKNAGFEWRESGCSLCVGLNEDMLLPTERCASTSNRNFEDRQGAGGRTHLMSPIMAAAAAINGRLSDARVHEQMFSRPQIPTMLHTAELLSQEGIRTNYHVNTSDNDGTQLDTSSMAGLSTTSTEKRHGTDSSNPSREFRSWTGRMVPLDRSNVDTDCIIPKQFLKAIGREGYSRGLFYYLRHTSRIANPKVDKSFTLNQPQYRGASVLLVTGENFGCGSSREHAVWALQGWGFRCILAPSFGDIFYNNAFQCGLLAIRITSPDLLRDLTVEAHTCREIVVDLLAQKIHRARDGSTVGTFEVEENYRQALMLGLDDIATTLQAREDIAQYENRIKMERPWVQSLPFLGNDLDKRVAIENSMLRDLSLEW